MNTVAKWLAAVVLFTNVASASSAASLEVEPGSSLYYIDKPDGGPDWSLRAQWTFLFPE